MKAQICRDPVLASERILYLQLFQHEYYGWISGSWVVGYRVHFSRHLIKDWWLVSRRGSYSRQVPAEWKAQVPPGS
jgi:hypothetical protein